MFETSLAATTRKLRASLENTTAQQTRKVLSAQPHVEEEFVPVDLSKNAFHIRMTDETTLEADKAQFIRGEITMAFDDPLAVRQEDIAKFDAMLNEFEQYYASLQDASIDTDQQSIRELMDRIRCDTKAAPEMKRMIESLQSTNSNIGQCSELLAVIKVARGLGKTIEELTDAMKASEETLNAKDRAESNLATYIAQLAAAQNRLTAAKKACDTAPRGLFGWGSIPAELVATKKNAQSDYDRINSRVLETQSTIEKLVAKLADVDAVINDPRLKILRSFDMTQHGMREKIEAAAQDVINTVNAIRTSIRTLITRVSSSEVAMKTIVDKIENSRIDRTVLISSFAEAYEANTKQIDVVSAKLEQLQHDFDATDADSVEAGRIRVDLMKMTATHKSMLEYNQRLDTMLKNMRTSDAASVISANDADRVLQSVRNNRDGFNTLANQTLPSLSEAMRLVLHQFADEQDQEFRMAIGQVTGQLGETAKDTAERALEQQKEFHKQKIDGISALIDRLGSASTTLGKALETQVRASIEEEQMYRKVTQAANDLRDGMNAATEIHAQVRGAVRAAGDDAAASLGFGPEAPDVAPTDTAAQ